MACTKRLLSVKRRLNKQKTDIAKDELIVANSICVAKSAFRNRFKFSACISCPGHASRMSSKSSCVDGPLDFGA